MALVLGSILFDFVTYDSRLESRFLLGVRMKEKERNLDYFTWGHSCPLFFSKMFFVCRGLFSHFLCSLFPLFTNGGLQLH